MSIRGWGALPSQGNIINPSLFTNTWEASHKYQTPEDKIIVKYTIQELSCVENARMEIKQDTSVPMMHSTTLGTGKGIEDDIYDRRFSSREAGF